MKQELKLRIISALVLAVIMLWATWAGGMVFRAVAIALGLLMYHEWSTITRLTSEDRAGFFAGWAVLVVVSVAIVAGAPGFGLLATVLAVTGFGLRGMMTGSGRWLAGGVAYAGLSAVAIASLRGDSDSGMTILVFLFAIVWGTDIAAYFTGRALGGPKLAPRISPGKTWSGAIGGTAIGVVSGLAVVMSMTSLPVLPFVAIAFGLSVFSQIGDLFESFVKRRFGVKDSSHLIPGHGGVLDRVDGLVFAAVLAYFIDIVILMSQGSHWNASAGTLLERF